MIREPVRPPDYWTYRRTSAHTRFRAARDRLLELREDPATARDTFRPPRERYFNWALEWFDVVAAEEERTALELLDGPGPADVGTRLGFAELSARSDTLAVELTALGMARGDRVLLMLGSRAELWESLLACLKIGAVVVPTYQDLTRAEAVDRLERGGIAHVLCSAAAARLLDGLPVPGLRIVADGPGPAPRGWLPYPDTRSRPRPFLPQGPTPAADPAFCYFTSGTTALPKLVCHTHASYPVGHLSSLYWQGLRQGDRHLNLSAPGWAKHSWSSFFVPWTAQATVVAPSDRGLPPDLLAAAVADLELDSLCAPPSAWRAMLPHLRPASAVRLREATAAGELLTPEVVTAVDEAWGVRVRDGYGQTEATALIGRVPGGPAPLSPLGHPLPGYRIVLRDPSTGALGDAGEICLDLADRPVGLMAGYAGTLPYGEADRLPYGDAGTLPYGEAAADGYYRTGDSAERCADGSIRLLGRMDEIFKSFGHRVSPAEIEAVLRQHPEVADAVVLPCPDPLGGLVPFAVVVPRRPAATPGQERRLVPCLLEWAAERLPELLVPKGVELVSGLPRTRSGKVRRHELARLMPFGADGGPRSGARVSGRG
jgi:acetyl-CoA synthetase